MLAMATEAPLKDQRFVYEPKYDGIRAIVDVRTTGEVHLWSRLGNDKTAQFPEIAHALQKLGRKLKASVILDGEIVALDEAGEPMGFQHLQGRIHVTGREDDAAWLKSRPAGLIAFDILWDGVQDLRPLPLVVRRARLERVLGNVGAGVVRLSRFVPADGTALYDEAKQHGWEGLIAKRLESPYRSGRRSEDWRKIKLLRLQEFVVGGWTDPGGSRPYFGALLLGIPEGDALRYVGHTGSGFTDAELKRVYTILKARETGRCPFLMPPKANQRPHWIRPDVVAEVTFSEWTADGRLRAPVYVGLRDDIRPGKVRREPPHDRGTRTALVRRTQRRPPAFPALPDHIGALVQRVGELADSGGAGVLEVDGHDLAVDNLNKIFWPGQGLTKADLLQYYLSVSPMLLPALNDRPLIMRRFPNGIHGQSFYQQRAPHPVPDGVRAEALPRDVHVPSRLVGGSLITLLYMVHLAVISQDPWFSRASSPDHPDLAVLDLDPMPGVTFTQVLDVARWIHDELDRLGIQGFPKTSGATGLHVYVPLPPSTSYESARLLCQIVATMVATQHPSVATVERTVDRRGATVYIDYLQNARGKTLASAYSARPSDFAGVSTPVTWQEIEAGIAPEDLTIASVVPRVWAKGDLWRGLQTAPPVDLAAVLEALHR